MQTQRPHVFHRRLHILGGVAVIHIHTVHATVATGRAIQCPDTVRVLMCRRTRRISDFLSFSKFEGMNDLNSQAKRRASCCPGHQQSQHVSSQYAQSSHYSCCQDRGRQPQVYRPQAICDSMRYATTETTRSLTVLPKRGRDGSPINKCVVAAAHKKHQPQERYVPTAVAQHLLGGLAAAALLLAPQAALANARLPPLDSGEL